ncbi:NfeD family protein [Corticibacterium sp. UT-5YL-CI-8]|nr:NfeD family protein [Tianweitania sp. UT-5YL-CI-8]
MIYDLILELGPWSWMLLGLVLLVLEIFMPGVFLLWVGIAALITGALSLALAGTAFWGWQVQVIVFLVLALIAAFAGRTITANRKDTSDQPFLNRRSAQMVGRTATLTEPIREGRGRIQLGDTMWRVAGPDLPAGARVRVVSAGETELDLVVEEIPAAL